MILSVFKKYKLGSVFKKSSSWDPTWTAGVLIASSWVLAVNPSVQGYFISVCVLYFKGRVYHFLTFKTVSSQIVGCLSPVVWGTHGSEVPLTIFFIIFKFIPVSFFSSLSLYFSPSQSHRKFLWLWPGYAPGSWVHGKVPLSSDWPENGLVKGLKGLIF